MSVSLVCVDDVDDAKGKDSVGYGEEEEVYASDRGEHEDEEYEGKDEEGCA